MSGILVRTDRGIDTVFSVLVRDCWQCISSRLRVLVVCARIPQARLNWSEYRDILDEVSPGGSTWLMFSLLCSRG